MTDEIAEKIKGKTCYFQDCGKPAVAVVVEKGDCVWMLVCGDHAALKIARACLTEAANRIEELQHGTGLYDVVQAIRSLLANLEGDATC